MRVFTAGLVTETNTFAPTPTGMLGFEAEGLFRGTASREDDGDAGEAARIFRRAAERRGCEVVEGVFTTAAPSGPTLTRVYEALRDEILHDIRARGPFDIVVLFLHGAMVAFDYEDCQGDLASRVRAATGPGTVIGVELDPHCHLTPLLVEATDCVVLMKEYPHTDFAERAEELFDICTRTARGEVRPRAAVFDCRMVGFYPTTTSPMRELVERMRAAERQAGVLSVSFAHGFPWGDTWETGSKVLAVTDDDPGLAEAVAASIGRAIYAQRNALLPRMPSMEQALEQALVSPGLTVLGDVADNPGGGAPGDNPSFLRLLVERRVAGAVVGCLCDPMAVRTCMEAAPGAAFDLRIGGKVGPASGAPFDHSVVVRSLKADHAQSGLGGTTQALGPSAWVECGGVDLVLCSERVQTFSPDAFTGLGVELSGRRLVVVKSSQHYQSGFAPIADHMVGVATPGAIQMDFAALPYRRRRPMSFHPRDPAPLG